MSSALHADGRTARAAPSGWRSLVVPLCFWGSLGGAALLSALLILSPRIVENERLQQRFIRNARELSLLSRETEHLTSLSRALQADADFVARFAVSELKSGPEGSVQVPLSSGLKFDARSVPAVEKSWTVEPFWGLSIAQSLSSPGLPRLFCQTGAVVLTLISFGCFQERLLAGIWNFLCRRVLHRYQSK